MQPQDLRPIELVLNIKVGLVGGFDGEKPSDDWSGGKIVVGNLDKFIVVERHDAKSYPMVYDTAALIRLPEAIQTKGYRHIEGMSVRYPVTTLDLLLIQRGPPDSDFCVWGPVDPTVNIFAFPIDIDFNILMPKAEDWIPKSYYLAGHAIMTIEEPFIDTDMARAMRQRHDYWRFSNKDEI